jgi:Ca2+-binding EF-hand superfamily protein
MVESSQEKYEIPFLYRKHFKTEACTQMVATFKGYDKNGDGKMDVSEFKGALKEMGHDEVGDDMAASLLKRFDADKSGFIEWVEFLDIMKMVKIKSKMSGHDFIN